MTANYSTVDFNAANLTGTTINGSNDVVNGNNDSAVIIGNNDTANGANDAFDESAQGDIESDGTVGDDGEEDFGADPIVLNLQGQRVSTVGVAQSSAFFDVQDNGQKVQTCWVTAGEGLLVEETGSRVKSEADLVPGFAALKAMDSNGDGVLDAKDAGWEQLKVWVDSVGDAKFQKGELFSLDQLGITSINLESVATAQNSNGNKILDDSSFTTASGSTGDIAGVSFAYNPAATPAETSVHHQFAQMIQSMASFQPQSGAMDNLLRIEQHSAHPTLAAAVA